MLKIAILGKANTGKNTTAKIIKNIYANKLQKRINTKIIAFADPIKEIILTMFPEANKDCLYGSSKLRSSIIDHKYLDFDLNPLTYRQALIDVGTKLGRTYNSNLWINNFDNRLKTIYYPKKPDLIVVSDTRFENEIDYLKDNDFYIVKLLRNSNVIINHSTETDQDKISLNKINYIIDNNKDFKHLKTQIKAIIDLI